MRPSRLPAPGGDAVDALVTDRYLDALLGGRLPGAPGVPTAPDAESPDAAGSRLGNRAGPADETAESPDSALLHASEVVRASLVRVHPSFRFEERLADRLAQLAAGTSRAVAAGGGDVIQFPIAERGLDDPLLAAVLDGRLDPADADAVAQAAGLRSPARPLLVGGAITSAALSLVGVAWVAWRASRPGGPAMSRAARAAHARRLAEFTGGVPGGPA